MFMLRMSFFKKFTNFSQNSTKTHEKHWKSAIFAVKTIT